MWQRPRHLMGVPSLNTAQALRRSVDEPESFAPVYEQHFAQILAFLTRRACDADLGMELTAETFAQAFLSRARFRGEVTSEAEAWLFKIAARKLSRFYRRSRVEAKAMRRLGMERPTITDQHRREIEEFADLDSLRTDLRAALAHVSPALRDAVGLRVVGELSYAEIATRLDISEQTARTRVSRGLKRLADSLDCDPAMEVSR